MEFEKKLDHSVTKPQFEGLKGKTLMPSFSIIFIQDPSEPSFGQEPPPKQSIVMSALIKMFSLLFLKTSLFSFHPNQSWLGLKITFCFSSLWSQERKSGDALKLLGNIRPLEPTNVSCPSASHQSFKSFCEKNE